MEQITLQVLLTRPCESVDDAKAKLVIVENAVSGMPLVKLSGTITVKEVPDND